MPQPHLRARSRKRRRITSPSGENRTHYKRGIASLPLCSICGKPIAGIPHSATVEMRGLNRSKKRIWRPFGGQVCPSCLKDAVKQAARTI